MSEKAENFLRSLSLLEQQIVDYIEPILASQGAELILLRVTGLKGKPSLALFIDKAVLDELARLSRLVSDALDVANAEHNWFSGAYQLEISSPGLDRALTKKSHFTDALGQQVKVKTSSTTLRGQLAEANDLGILINTHPELISWSDIRDANIIRGDSFIWNRKT